MSMGTDWHTNADNDWHIYTLHIACFTTLNMHMYAARNSSGSASSLAQCRTLTHNAVVLASSLHSATATATRTHHHQAHLGSLSVWYNRTTCDTNTHKLNADTIEYMNM